METTETTERRPGLDWTGNVVGRCPHCAALGRVCAEHSDRERVERCLMACTGLDPAVVPELVEALRAAVARVGLANDEGDPILSAWLPDAKALLARLEGGA